jgi:hypothetical protein
MVYRKLGMVGMVYRKLGMVGMVYRKLGMVGMVFSNLSIFQKGVLSEKSNFCLKIFLEIPVSISMKICNFHKFMETLSGPLAPGRGSGPIQCVFQPWEPLF